MTIIPEITNVIPLDDYILFVEFADWVSGEIPLKKWVGNGVFSYWNDERAFKNFIITKDKKLQWSEDIDMDPDSFYLQLINKTFGEYAGDQQLLRHFY